MSGGLMSGGRMSGGRLSSGLMSGGLMSAHHLIYVAIARQLHFKGAFTHTYS